MLSDKYKRFFGEVLIFFHRCLLACILTHRQPVSLQIRDSFQIPWLVDLCRPFLDLFRCRRSVACGSQCTWMSLSACPTRHPNNRMEKRRGKGEEQSKLHQSSPRLPHKMEGFQISRFFFNTQKRFNLQIINGQTQPYQLFELLSNYIHT